MKNSMGDRAILVQLRMALLCVVLTVIGGAASALHYIPSLSLRLNELGLGMAKLRPVHTTFASVWIFGAAVAVVYHYMAHTGGGLSRGDVRRFWAHTVCWCAAGAGILVSLLAGITSGREYVGFHPAFSAILLAGWLAFAMSFLKRSLKGFWKQPVYIWFWTVGILYFIYTFTEAHAYLLPWVGHQPIRDLQIQWKSCGTLVGSFNFMVYGALIYVTERMTGNRSYAQSPIAFRLFGVGCLNSFTNYVHHTYHLPQNHIVKWVAFVVSMMEALILLRVLMDIRAMLGQQETRKPFRSAISYLTAAKWWTAAMVLIALLISVPSLNSLIHGTKVVTGHAMGTELGIDSMILFGAIAFLFSDLHARNSHALARLDHVRMKSHLLFMNLSMAALVGWLTVAGSVHGYYRYHGEAAPAWIGYEKMVFPLTGAAVGIALLLLVASWTPLLFCRPGVSHDLDSSE